VATLHWNGTALAPMTPGSSAIWATGPSSVYLAVQNVEYYNGTGFALVNTGLSGVLEGLSGTSDTRLYAAGERNSDSLGVVPFHAAWGGPPEPIPAGTLSLNGVWAAPSGEVFAVGSGGTILRGP